MSNETPRPGNIPQKKHGLTIDGPTPPSEPLPPGSPEPQLDIARRFPDLRGMDTYGPEASERLNRWVNGNARTHIESQEVMTGFLRDLPEGLREKLNQAGKELRGAGVTATRGEA